MLSMPVRGCNVYMLALYPLSANFLLLFPQGNMLEKLRICSMPKFVRFIHDLVRIKKDPTLVVTNTCFGTVPVRLFQPKTASSSLRRGIIFFHGGAAMFGSLGKYLPCVVEGEGLQDRWSLTHIPIRTSWEGVKDKGKKLELLLGRMD